MLTMAVVIPITGFLLQRFATRPIFIAAMSLFSAGTLIAALAPGFEVLLLGSRRAGERHRDHDAAAHDHPHDARGHRAIAARLMGSVSIVISVAPAIGPTISGLILNYLSWRFMFWLVLPIALVDARHRHPPGRERERAARDPASTCSRSCSRPSASADSSTA